jgi:diadenylate cyclase
MEWLTEFLRQRPAISWWDLLDIALVSILIYELLLLIRGTRAMQMALSGGFLIASSSSPNGSTSKPSTG